MPHSQLYKALQSISPLSSEAWNALHPLFTPRTFSKGEIMVAMGEQNDTTAFVLAGAMRAYYVDQHGTSYNKTFFVANSFAASIASVLSQQPSYLNFDALVESTTLCASYTAIMALFESHREIETLVRKLIEYEWVIKKEKRELRLVMNSAAERYAFFQEEYPGLENQIPQYHIASHLGITPVQLSRIRNQKGKY